MRKTTNHARAAGRHITLKRQLKIQQTTAFTRARKAKTHKNLGLPKYPCMSTSKSKKLEKETSLLQSKSTMYPATANNNPPTDQEKHVFP